MIKKNTLKLKAMSILLVVAMMVTLLPEGSVKFPIFAAEEGENVGESETTTGAETLPTIDDVTIEAYSGKYNEAEHSAVDVAEKEGDIVSYSTDGGITFDSAVPMIKTPGTINVIVKVERTGYETFISEEVTAEVTKGDLSGKVSITPYSGTYNETDQKAVTAVSVDSNDVCYIEFYNAANDTWSNKVLVAEWETIVPTVRTAENHEIKVRITSDYYETYETTVTASIGKATIDASKISVTAYSGDYDGNSYALIASASGLDKYTITYDITEGEGLVEYDEDGNPFIRNAGTVKFNITLSRDGYANHTIYDLKATVNKIAPAFDWESIPDKEIPYTEGEKITLVASSIAEDDYLVSTGPISYEVVSGLATIENDDILTYTNSGAVKIKATIAEDDNHNSVSVEYTFNIGYVAAPNYVMSTPTHTETNENNEVICKWYAGDVYIEAENWYVCKIDNEEDSPSRLEWKNQEQVSDEGSYDAYTVRFIEAQKGEDGEMIYGKVSNPVTIEKFAIDKTAPEITDIKYTDYKASLFTVNILTEIASAPTAYGYFFNGDTTVKIYASDADSGVKSITYKVLDITGIELYSGTKDISVDADGNAYIEVAITKDFKGSVYAYATDNVGNIPDIYKYTNGAIVEKIDKHTETSDIKLTMPKSVGLEEGTYSYEYKGDARADKNMDYITTSRVPLYDANLKAEVKVSDTYSGIAKVEWTVIKGNTEESYRIEVEAEGKLAGEKDGWTASKEEGTNLVTSLEGTISIEGNSNDMVLLVELTDNAGNKSYDYYVFGIDKTAPTISIEYDNNQGINGYYNKERVATITVTERNFNEDAVKEKVKKNGKKYTTSLTWKKIEGKEANGDDTQYVATLEYYADGDYTFDISANDRAKNTSSDVEYGESNNPTEFTIDMTLPVVSVEYDNNDAQNEKYFDAARTATITVKEHNFNSSKVTATIKASLNGNNIKKPVLSDWTQSDDTYTATIKYMADGDYRFDIVVTDEAGNKNDKVKYGSSVAAKDFTVDTTITNPVITGVENGKSYKDEVIPTIKFADVNFATREITLTRTRKDEKDVDVTEELIANVAMGSQGGTIVSDTFDKDQDLDGIYTLSLKMTDKAGNESAESITFTVNRYGSVYVFNDYLIEVQNSYKQKIDRNIVVTEYNPNKLVEGSLKISVTRDGAPIDDLVYTVDPVINGKVEIGESGWYQYVYVINASNFSKDGVYTIAVSSEDTVGNKPETTNYDDCKVVFMVDTTVAEITNIKGLEDSIINAEKLDVSFEVFDAIGLKAITVYVDGKAVKTFDKMEDLINFTGTFTLTEGANQKIEIVVEDLAGNKLSTSSDAFKPEYDFKDEVTVSTNLFVRWFADKLVFFGSIAGFLLIVGGIIFLILKKKNKEEEEAK